MKKLLKFVVIPVLATALTALFTVTGVSADSESGVFRWLAAAGLTDVGQLCDLGTPCPDAAMALNGNTIDITGEGVLTVHPKTIDGGGRFTATALVMGGDPVRKKDKGTWEAVELLSFKSYGPAIPDITPPDFPGTFLAGLAIIRIHLMVKGDWVADAVLRLGCILPGTKVPGGARSIVIVQ